MHPSNSSTTEDTISRRRILKPRSRLIGRTANGFQFSPLSNAGAELFTGMFSIDVWSEVYWKAVANDFEVSESGSDNDVDGGGYVVEELGVNVSDSGSDMDIHGGGFYHWGVERCKWCE